MTRSKTEFYQQASLSQKLSHKDDKFRMLAGADRKISESIGVFLTLGELGYIDLEDPSMKLTLALLDIQRKAVFATSEKVNEITKMGMMMPKGDDIVDAST